MPINAAPAQPQPVVTEPVAQETQPKAPPTTTSPTSRQHFDQLIRSGKPIGELYKLPFFNSVRGLQPTNVHAVVLFENGSRGFVYQILSDEVQILYLGEQPPLISSMVGAAK